MSLLHYYGPYALRRSWAAAEKRLQDIHEQELKDRKQERTYKVALNQATLKALAASTT